MARSTGSGVFFLLLASLVFGFSSCLNPRRSELGGNIFHVHYEDDDVLRNDLGWRPFHHPEYSLPVPEMIRSYGYICEIHNYTTADGYINTLHRIPPSPGAHPKHQAVFVQHGLLGTSADFVMGSPAKSLGYLLADQGYDVWLGNARGNAYSRKHVNLTTRHSKYWKFSFDEMGKFDVPAAISYALETTAQSDPKAHDKIFYIGHSMGTIMFWVAMNEHQAWMEDHVTVMVAMGPVAHVEHVKGPIRLLAPFATEFEYLFSLLGVNEFVPSNVLTQMFDEIACDPTMRQLKLCENFIFLLTGFDAKEMNMTMLPIILGHEPGGGSTQTVIHFAQEINSKKFCKFDHGRRGNMNAYNQSSPPEYDLQKVTVPVALMWSDNDWLADPKDVEKLFDLPRLLDNYEVPLKGFNHVDFIWGIDADELIYKKIFDYFDGFTKLDVEHLEQLYASKRETVERVMPEREEVEEEEEARLLNGQHAEETLSFQFPTFPEN